MDTQLSLRLWSILDEMVNMYQETLRYMDPTDHCNKEANLTTFFHKALLRTKYPFKPAVSYDEFPVPRKFRPGKTGDTESDAIDSVFYFPRQNELFLIEAKEKMNPWNSIAWDILRANNVVDSAEVFPGKLKNAQGEYLGAAYNETKVLGIVLYGHWSFLELDDAKNEIVAGLRGANDPCLGSHAIDGKDLLVKGVRLQDQAQINEGWHYYIALYAWTIHKRVFEQDSFSAPPLQNDEERRLGALTRIVRPLSNVLNPSLRKSNTKNWRFKPTCLTTLSQDHSDGDDDFWMWIPLCKKEKLVVLCGLSKKNTNASLNMPTGWVKDIGHTYDGGSYKNNFIYELGDWADLDSPGGKDKIRQRIAVFAATVPDIKLVK